MTIKTCPNCNGKRSNYIRETATLELRRCADCERLFAVNKEGAA